jgi:hypothetical protein
MHEGRLSGDVKQGVNEGALAEYIALSQAAHPPLANHVHRLIAADRVCCALY